MLSLFPGDESVRDTIRFAEATVGYGLWQVDLASGVLECSPNTRALLGLSPASWNPDNTAPPLTFSIFETVAHPDDLPALAEIHHVLEDGLPFEREFRVIHRNGHVRSLLIRGEVLVDSAGRSSRVIGVLIDITHHVENLHASQIDSERVRGLIEAIGGSVWTSRADGFITDFIMRNPETVPDPAKYLGTNWQTMFHPDDVEKRMRVFQKAIANKAPYTNDYRVRGADGNFKWRRSYVAPLLNQNGSIREWVGLSLYVHGQGGANAETAILTGAQIRAARGIVNWSVRDLADRTGLSAGVVRRLEANNGATANATEALVLIKDALSAAGVEFFVLPDGEAGVFPARKESRIKIAHENEPAKKFSA